MPVHKIVYAFIAFDDIKLLERKIKFLYTQEDYFIVHWNKYSSRAKMQQLQEVFKDKSNVYIYSKVKVVWGTNSILLAILENMRLALQRGGGQFDHFIVLSEQCIPVKTKEYIKTHLAQYQGKSFCASFNFMPEIPFPKCPNSSDSFRLTRYYYTFLGGKGRSPLHIRLKDAVRAVTDCFFYAVPICANIKESLYRMACTYPFRTLYRSYNSFGEKIKFVFRYMMCFPWRFIVCVLCGRETWIGNYGRKSKLLSLCIQGHFQVTKNSGPSACYCREDVEFLCLPENWKLARSLNRYFAPEEFFCQTLLYNSKTQRKNFLNESLCAADYHLQDINAVLNYLEEDKFPTGEFCDISKDYHFQHICFLRKISDSKIWDFVESRLTLERKKEQKEV